MGMQPGGNAPSYIVGLLATLLGWHLSELADDIRSTRAVSYRIERPEPGRIVAEVHNVSKTRSLVEVDFALACPGRDPCVAPDTHRVEVHPPNAPGATTIHSGPRAVLITTTLAAGGRLEFGAALSDKGVAPRFLFVPSETNPLDIYVFDAASPRGFVVENYFEIILASFALLSIAFVALLVRASWPKGGARRQPPPEAANA